MARDDRTAAGWLALGAAAFALLPWYALADKSLVPALAEVWSGPDGASGLAQAARFGKSWLWCVPVGLALGLVGMRAPSRRRSGALLAGGALLGLAAILVFGFAIGAAGWSFDLLARAFGPLPAGQPGLGIG